MSLAEAVRNLRRERLVEKAKRLVEERHLREMIFLRRLLKVPI